MEKSLKEILQQRVKGFGNSATRDIGTTAGTVAAGDDPRFFTSANAVNIPNSGQKNAMDASLNPSASNPFVTLSQIENFQSENNRISNSIIGENFITLIDENYLYVENSEQINVGEGSFSIFSLFRINEFSNGPIISKGGADFSSGENPYGINYDSFGENLYYTENVFGATGGAKQIFIPYSSGDALNFNSFILTRNLENKETGIYSLYKNDLSKVEEIFDGDLKPISGSSNLNNNFDLRLGGDYFNNDLNCSFKNVNLFNFALSEYQCQEIFNNGIPLHLKRGKNTLNIEDLTSENFFFPNTPSGLTPSGYSGIAKFDDPSCIIITNPPFVAEKKEIFEISFNISGLDLIEGDFFFTITNLGTPVSGLAFGELERVYGSGQIQEDFPTFKIMQDGDFKINYTPDIQYQNCQIAFYTDGSEVDTNINSLNVKRRGSILDLSENKIEDFQWRDSSLSNAHGVFENQNNPQSAHKKDISYIENHSIIEFTGNYLYKQNDLVNNDWDIESILFKNNGSDQIQDLAFEFSNGSSSIQGHLPFSLSPNTSKTITLESGKPDDYNSIFMTSTSGAGPLYAKIKLQRKN
jgi:hypothetical protein